MRSKRTPCYKCEERHEACHSACEKYIEWRKDHDRRKAEERKEIDLRHDLAAVHEATYRRLKH